MKNIWSAFGLFALMVLNAWSASSKPSLMSIRQGDVFWSSLLNDRVYAYSVWPKGQPSKAETILVPFSVAVDPEARRKYIVAAYSTTGTPVIPTPEIIEPTLTDTPTAESLDTPTVTPTPVKKK